jgi:hypothetical protein
MTTELQADRSARSHGATGARLKLLVVVAIPDRRSRARSHPASDVGHDALPTARGIR